MELEMNKKLVTTILKQIPKNEKPVLYLVNALNISRESAYRRIRGDIPFTIQELVALATNLDFSIDAVFEQEKQNHSFFDFTRLEKNSTNYFVLMLDKYMELLEKINLATKLEMTMSFNVFPPPFYVAFANLFKFMYYKWVYQEKEFQRGKSYSELLLPDEVVVFQKRMRGNLFQGKEMVIILDMNIFLNLIKEIQYYYHRKLLTSEELLLLKEDMLGLIEQYEKIAQTGSFGAVRIQLYLSLLCVNSNTIYYKYDEKVEPFFWIFTINPVIIQNAKFASMQLKWLNSLKRQSTLISQSNEIMQSDFFYQQREYIDKYLSVENAL